METGGDATVSLRPTFAGDGTHYLLVIEAGETNIFPLAKRGTFLIGRAPECEVQLRDNGCSRRHAALDAGDDGWCLRDLESHNGTRVNGDLVSGGCALGSGDVITIGDATLVLHAARNDGRRALLGDEPFRRRLAEEVDRAVRYERPLALLALLATPSTIMDLVAALEPELRLIDVVGHDAGHVYVVMPELDRGDALAAAERVAAKIADGSRPALAICPDDGCRADVLLASARAASGSAGAGVRLAGDAIQLLTLGDRQLVVAEPSMVQLFDLVRRLATSELPVLVRGETGAGKENVAHALHCWSSRGKAPLVAVNCASIPENLVESELFGYEKGAFSGAAAAKVGLVEAAHGGTLFLDEVAELAPAAQAKLLRVLETRQLLRLGSLKERPVDVRLVAATHRDLAHEVAAGRFREDLLFRLRGASVTVPPLRDRPREIAVLARRFLDEACRAANRPAPILSAAAMDALTDYRWPGNVRELKHELEFVAATVEEGPVEPWHLSERVVAVNDNAAAKESPEPAARRQFRALNEELRELERRRMQEALAAADGVHKRAAELIGMPIRTFGLKVKQYGLRAR